ncbi:GGDEF domain-containing protein [Mucisphaera calidilacus]|uniref:diguanylate cyclase n=1 Tax=Mucisphaera calidilacus TaxID=2527982 RepID=A0A518C0J8_9BACT|nr:diguanylate cyclase [Mucisphaera calidilacus]QDU72751.1 Diguanylate cyclase DosC [Mucisphaera calidilacus]
MIRPENDIIHKLAPQDHTNTRVLIIGADRENKTDWERALTQHQTGQHINWADGIEKARHLLHGPDLAIILLHHEDDPVIDLITHWQNEAHTFPVLVIADHDLAHLAPATIRAGACDFVIRTDNLLNILPTIIEKNLEQHRLREDHHALQAQLRATLTQVKLKNQQLEEAVTLLETAAATDPLTGLANRRAISEALERGFAEAQRYNRDLACLMIDLDGFKQLNDAAGHAFGDLMLRELARVLKSNSRRSDCVGRLGGDEFVILMPETDEQTARQVADRIAGEFAVASRAQLLRHGQKGNASVSTGITTRLASNARRPEQLLVIADQDLYAAKKKHHDRDAASRHAHPAVELRLTTNPDNDD